MTRTTLGTCCGCGFGASVPYTPDLKPGTPVVVMTEKELESLLTPSSQGATS